MERNYLDNASTTFPKPKSVADAVYTYMTSSGSNINRGCYDSAYDVEELVFETRQMLAELFNGGDCKNVVFTKNVTESLKKHFHKWKYLKSIQLERLSIQILQKLLCKLKVQKANKVTQLNKYSKRDIKLKIR